MVRLPTYNCAVQPRRDPSRVPDKVGQMRGLFYQLRYDLDCRAAISDHANTFVAVIVVTTPCSGMDKMAFERVDAFDGRPTPVVQESSSGDQDVTGVVDYIVAVAYLDMPLSLCLIEFRFFNTVAAFDIPC